MPSPHECTSKAADMKTYLAAKVQRQDRNGRHKRFERRPDEFIRDTDRTRARKIALADQLARTKTSNVEDRKEPKA